MLWINYFVFRIGYSVVKTRGSSNSTTLQPWIIMQKSKNLYFLSILSIVFSALAIYFYTGQTPFNVIYNLSNGISVYAQYQKFFAENQRSVFSLVKLPFVFMMFYVKATLIYSYIAIFLMKNKVEKTDIHCILLLTFAHIYFGISRGTNFEFFELALLIIYVLLTKMSLKNKTIISMKVILIIFALISVMILIFYLVLITRGIDADYFTKRGEFFDPNGFVSKVLPLLSFIILILYDYFGFGFYYIASFISRIWFNSGISIVAGFVPLGLNTILQDDLVTVMNNTISMGPRWHPDQILVINNFGYMGLIILCFTLGVFAKYVQLSKNMSTFTYVTLFMIFLQMISLPVGNFISVSSSNKLVSVTLISYWLLETLKRNQKIVKYIVK
jgi:hypothetical protein